MINGYIYTHPQSGFKKIIHSLRHRKAYILDNKKCEISPIYETSVLTFRT
jgi:hypothetical protein